MQNMSFSMTTPQMCRRGKIVTRRCGWFSLKPGQLLRAVVKGMGLKHGEKMQPIALLVVVGVRAEKLREMTDRPEYGFAECKLEGFGDDPRLKWPSEFVKHFCASHGKCTAETVVNRIEFRFVPGGNCMHKCPICRGELRTCSFSDEAWGASRLVESHEICRPCGYIRSFSYGSTYLQLGVIRAVGIEYCYSDTRKKQRSIERRFRRAVRKARRTFVRIGRRPL